MSKVVLLFPGTAAGVDDQTREVIILVISPARKLLFFTLSRLTVLRFYIFEKSEKGSFASLWLELKLISSTKSILARWRLEVGPERQKIAEH